jgi:hypothetical protein
MIDRDGIRGRFEALSPYLGERERRLFAATEAKAAGFGGIAAVSEVTGIAVSTIGRGLKELALDVQLEAGRARRSGGGCKPLSETDKSLLSDLLGLVEPDARGDPMSPLRWTCKSLRQLAAEMRRLGHKISHTVIGELLKQQKFSLQGNRKTREGGQHPDRDAQFRFINTAVKAALAEDQPVISVDAKKKELVGDFKNNGREWRPQGDPEEVRVHDFLIKELGRAVPYGIYDIATNTGWVGVGMDNDTSAFAVNTIRRWWWEIGHYLYANANRLVITADGGGSNGSRVRLWKRELQLLADEIGVAIEVHHLPPGTSKWNQIEHKLFSFITMNWRAKPLLSYCIILELISATTTKSGLAVYCELDKSKYQKGIVISDAEMETLALVRDEFHGEWNYTIKPRAPQNKSIIS